jgi:hypothetical protein
MFAMTIPLNVLFLVVYIEALSEFEKCLISTQVHLPTAFELLINVYQLGKESMLEASNLRPFPLIIPGC